MYKGSGIIGLGLFGLLSFFLREATAVPLFNLGTAQSFTVLQVGNGSINQQIDLNNPQGGITGNVGVTSNGTLQSNGPTITGNLYLGNNASAQFSGSYNNNRPVSGTTHLGGGSIVGPGSYNFTSVSDNPQALLNQARLDSINASVAAGRLAATSTLSNITTSMTLSGTGVYYLNSLNLGSNATLTLSGSATDSFVFNISSIFKLVGAQILLTGGLTADHVLFNYTGTTDVTVSGSNSLLHGIILALNARVNLSPGLMIGQIISGQDISISSGANVRQTALTAAVPESGQSLFLLGLGLLGLAGARFAIVPWSRSN
ncbi:MAG: collagen-binding domain-containing protein [Chthoniobacterales bacterium]